MIGKTLAHYRIVERIGAGGMGEVYRAEDIRLGRQVAVKLMPPDVAGDPDRLARFEREARAVAALSHPNTLAIHDFGSDAGIVFAVMELLEGETLRDELRRVGSLPASEVAVRGAQIARGLAAAHEKGIVHRDLKPENLFVLRDGRMKILDFGLAKVTAVPAAEVDGSPTAFASTAAGALLGTVSYMSPEQARGLPADARSDLFALGIVLYEMLTGTNPFHRGSPAEILSAVLRDDPRPVDVVVPAVAGELARTVHRCLEKDPRKRPASAKDVAHDLESGGARPSRPVAAPGAIDSLAVLPFRNESTDEDAEYLSDGITDMLIDNLSQLPSLKVLARSTVFRYRDESPGPMEIGAALGVRAVLTGRLRRRGDEMVVRTELVDATDGSRLWGGRFHRPVADLLAVEEEISREISEKLRLRLTGAERQRLAKRPTDNPEAHEQYLRGRHVWNRWKTPEGMRMAIGFFERALALDPLYARAFAGLADSWSVLGNVKALPPGEAYPAARTAAEQGLAIDDGLAELHTSLAFIQRHWDWDWDAAERGFRRAIELNPGYATAHRWYGGLLSGLGRHEEAIAEGERALELDPLNLLIHTSVGDFCFYARRYDEAMTYYRKALEVDPQLLPAHTDLARALELAGRYEEAISEYGIGASLAPKGPPEPSSGLAHVYARMGRREEALAIVRQLQELSTRRYVSPYGIASIHACLGDNETALDWLERAYAEHDQTLVWLKVHPRLDGLHDEPRYRELLRKMRLA